MEVAREEVDNQQAMRGAETHVPALEIDDSAELAIHESAVRAGAASNPIMSTEHARERVKDKEKEKVDERMKEPVYIRGVLLVDLDNMEVSDKDLMIDTSKSDDDVSPNPDGIGIRGGPRSCSQTMDSNVEFASRLVALEVEEHCEPHTTPTASIDDPLFNATGKASHLDAVVVKQEAG